MFQKFERITVAVPDLEAAQQRLVRILGLTPFWTGRNPQEGTRHVAFRLDNCEIELLAPESGDGAATGLAEKTAAAGHHIHALTLATDDAQAAAETLQSRGLAIDAPSVRLSQDEPSGAFRRENEFAIPLQDANGIRLYAAEDLALPDEIPPSLPIGDLASTCHAVDHVVVLSQQPERAKRFYGDTLGIRLALDRSFEKRETRILFFRMGGMTLEVGASTRVRGTESEGAKDEPDRFWGLALQVADIELARERMQAGGIGVSGIRDGFKSGTRVFSVKDPIFTLPCLVIQPVATAD